MSDNCQRLLNENNLKLSETLPQDISKLLKQLEIAMQMGDDALIPNAFRGY